MKTIIGRVLPLERLGKVWKCLEKKKGIRESLASAATLHPGRAGAFVSWDVKLEMCHEVRKGRGWLEGWGLSGERVKAWFLGGGNRCPDAPVMGWGMGKPGPSIAVVGWDESTQSKTTPFMPTLKGKNWAERA